MQQVFNFQQLGNSLAGLFDGSNATRGRADRARAEYEEQRARELKRQNDMLDAGARDEISAQLAFGGDTVKIRQALQDLPVPKMIQPQEQNQLGGLFKVGAQYATAPANTDLGRGESAEMGQQYMNSRYTMSAEDQNAFKRAMQNVIMHAAMGGNGRTMGQNLLDFENQDKNTLYQAAAMNMLRQGNIDGANAITSVSKGKAYLPNRMTSNGIMYNQATGGYDEGSATAQAGIANTTQDTAYKGAQTQKTLNDISLSNQDFSIKYGKYLTDADPNLFKKTIVDEQGKTSVIEDTDAVKEATIYALQNGISINQARQMILSGKTNASQNQGNNPFIASISSSFMPQKSEIKHPADLARAVQSGQMTPEQADQYANKMGW